MWPHDIWQDVRLAWRGNAKDARLAAVLVMTIALGVGVNVAIFSIVDGFRKPLPVPDADRLVVLAARIKGDESGTQSRFSHAELEDFRAASRGAFSDLFAYSLQIEGITNDGRGTPFLYGAVSGNYFQALGLSPALGRFFEPGEGEHPGVSSVVVLGHSFWQSHFGSDPAIVGRQVRIGGASAEVVGVAPPGFRGTYAAIEMDGFLPLNGIQAGERSNDRVFNDRTARWLTVLGRLAPATTIDEAQAVMTTAAQRLERQYPETNNGVGVRVIPERWARPEPAGLLNDARQSDEAGERFLLSLAGLVLLLACVNVTNVLLVRATGRRRELAVRAALGATRGRLIRQALTETALLSVLGAAVGLLLGTMWRRALERSIVLPAYLGAALDFSLNWRVFVYALLAAVTAGSLAAIWPAIRVSKLRVAADLRDGGGGIAGGGRERQRLRSVLVAGQMAVSLVLLVVAALFVRDLRRAATLDLGFAPGGLLNVVVDPRWAGYEAPRTDTFYREVERRLRTLPGVESVGQAFSVPMGYYRNSNVVLVDGRPLDPDTRPPLVSRNYASPSYFDTIRMPIVRGRGFTENDVKGEPLVAIVNETMAARFWPGEDPIGKTFRGDDGPQRLRIVGVARDSKYVTLWEAPQPYFYLPLAQYDISMRAVQIRSEMPVDRLSAAVRQAIEAIGPDVPIADIQTMTETLSGVGGFMLLRLGARQAAAMGLIGLMLAIVGVYGVASYSTARRTREIGIRVAVGAAPRDVLRLVLSQGVLVIAGGVALGVAGAVGVTRLLAQMLGMERAGDPRVFVAVTLLIVGTALGAYGLPARRALRVSPTLALRQE
jgi:predicted permease